jgi:cytochrome c biogenesis protein CcdA
VIDGQFALALATGMVAAVNPCGFAMLPAYLGFFLGTETDDRTTSARVTRALIVGASLTLGFLTVFLVVGVPLRNASSFVTNVSGWLTLVAAVVLIAVGVAIVAGWRLPIATPKMARGGRSGEFRSMFLFGVSYAVASLGCALPLFLVTLVGGSRRNGILSGVVATGMYGLGMGLVITALTVSLAVASGSLLRVLRSAMRFVDRAAGMVMVLAGIYLVFYGIEEIQVARGNLSQSGVTRRGGDLQAKIQNFIAARDPVVLGTVLAAVVALGALLVIAARRRGAHR